MFGCSVNSASLFDSTMPEHDWSASNPTSQFDRERSASTNVTFGSTGQSRVPFNDVHLSVRSSYTHDSSLSSSS